MRQASRADRRTLAEAGYAELDRRPRSDENDALEI